MLKKISFILILIVITSCNKEDANDCFQTSGSMITEEFVVSEFTKIEVNEGINLVVKEAANQEVLVETGANLMNDVEATVVGETLFLSDNNNCNYFRDYGVTTIYVTVPNLTEINSKTQFEVRSEGVLTFPKLSLISENFTNNSPASGNFRLEVQNDELSINFNNLSNLFISGTTKVFTISIPGGNPRIEAENFETNKVIISSRGSNDIIINPREELTGNIYGTGDVIAVNHPAIVTLTAHYTGKLIFN